MTTPDRPVTRSGRTGGLTQRTTTGVARQLEEVRNDDYATHPARDAGSSRHAGAGRRRARRGAGQDQHRDDPVGLHGRHAALLRRPLGALHGSQPGHRRESRGRELEQHLRRPQHAHRCRRSARHHEPQLLRQLRRRRPPVSGRPDRDARGPGGLRARLPRELEVRRRRVRRGRPRQRPALLLQQGHPRGCRGRPLRRPRGASCWRPARPSRPTTRASSRWPCPSVPRRPRPSS